MSHGYDAGSVADIAGQSELQSVLEANEAGVPLQIYENGGHRWVGHDGRGDFEGNLLVICGGFTMKMGVSENRRTRLRFQFEGGTFMFNIFLF